MNAASILVVEDNVDTLKVIELCLTSLGYAVTCAQHGREAMRLLTEREFDLVMTDLLMPDVDGMEVIVAVRRHQPATPVIVMSGGGRFMGGRELMKLGIKLGAHSELPKPFTPAQLTAAVSRHCGTNRSELAGAA